MIQKILFSSLLILWSISICCQQKYDYVWLFSNNSGPAEGSEATFLDFNNGKLNIDSININAQIGSNNTSYCDSDGRLTLYSNACEIYDSTHQVALNGGGINPGVIHDNWCHIGEYPSNANSLFLEDPSGDGVYFIHKNIVNVPNDVTFPDLMYSYIDHNLDVIEKNIKIDSIRYKPSGYLEAIRHGNGRDWWLIEYTEVIDSGYLLKYLINPEGISLYEEVKYENQASLENECSGGGQSCFAPDGTRYVKFCPESGLDVFDFDSETCDFSNYRKLNIPQIANNLFSGVAMSPSGRFVYISNRVKLVQVDLEETDPLKQVVWIDDYDGGADPFPSTFAFMQIAPDCKIYMSSTNGNRSLHVINNPDEKGKDCNFVQRGLQLKSSSRPTSIPNHPVFRLDGDAVCDPTITKVFDIPVQVLRDLEIYPNPTYSDVTVNVPDAITDGVLSIRSLSGQQLLQQEIKQSGDHLVSLSAYQNGVYVIELVSDSSVYLGKVVKVE